MFSASIFATKTAIRERLDSLYNGNYEINRRLTGLVLSQFSSGG
ncbi:hypothetical protein CRENPOLYSF1_430023 [Crenothrix polyspora]|uniref:Uncharacterized protein n=1 Tax=Crenothrix polyspora TaxID=360316 RepID=A0A1R4HAM0_9GAMM|nr:hypothetical protein CRENPOLYSF1_430023 [Crenothrix polyspora]